MKKFLIPALLLIFMTSIVEDANAQRKKRRKRDKEKTEDTRKSRRSSRDAGDEEEYKGWKEKLVYDINIGNIQLNNGYFGLSLKSQVGYKLHDRVTAGVGIKYFYNLFTQRGADDFHLNDIGGLAFTRLKVTESIFIHAEYSYLSFDNDWWFQEDRRNFHYPLFGAGYASGFGNWKSIIQLLFIGSEEVREIGNSYPVELWFGVSKNF